MDVIDLFSGIGGIKLGFKQAGFTTVFSVDFEQKCATTYNLNFDDVKLTVSKVEDLSIKKLPACDVVAGGFPCQPFSIAGKRKGFNDKDRGNLFWDIMGIVRVKRPKVVFLENVKNLKSHDNGKTYKTIERALTKAGYFVKSQVLNSMTHGNVPQNRERIFIVGFLSEKAYDLFSFPAPIPLTKTIADVLETNVDQSYFYTKGVVYKKIKKEITKSNTVYQWRRKYVRENKNGVCPTLTANMGMGGHNVPLVKDKNGIRKLTIRECARLQGFPDSYKFPTSLSRSAIYKQLGNSVTVPVIKRIALNIKKAVENS